MALVPALAGAAAVAGVAAASHAAAPSSPQQLVRTAIGDASSKASAHVVFVGAPLAVVANDDVGMHDGIQTAVFPKPDAGELRAIVIGATAYVSARPSSLLAYAAGLSKAVAQRAGTRWVSIPSSSSLYSGVALDVTLPSELATVQPTSDVVELAPSMFSGQRVIGIRGKTGPAAVGFTSVTVYLSQSAHPLPVYATFSGPHGIGQVDRFSKWGERIAAAAPANAVSVASLGG